MTLISYIQGLTITQGEGIGEPFRLLPWERRFCKGAFSTSGDAAYTAGRGNGKTAFIAGIGCAAIDDDGPLVQPRAETVIVASSFDQGKIDFEHCMAFLEAKGHDLDNRKHWRKHDTNNKALLENKKTGARIRCIGSDPARAHGLAPVLVIADEPAQWPGTTADRMYSALRTAMGKIPGSKMIAMGTRPVGSDHFFAKMLAGADYSQVHAAGPNDPVFAERTWHKANPSLKYMPDLLDRIRKEAAEAKKDPSLLPQFKALRLNLGVSDTEIQVLIDAGVWVDAEGDAEISGSYALGLDLGSSAAMSGAAGYWPDSGRLDTLACFGDNPSLAERGLADGVGNKYVEMFKRQELILSEGRVSSIRDLLDECLERWGPPGALVCDRWREDELRDVLDRMGFPRCALIVRGMGYLDGGADVRDFRRAMLKGYVTPVRSLLLRYAMSEARVVMDTAGNSKLAKKTEGQRRLKARDDATAAAVLSVASGYRLRSEGRTGDRQVYHGRV